MNDFIESVTNQLGLDESTAKGATGSVLGFLKSGLGDQFSEIASKLPGADELISQAPEATSSSGGGGGLLGSITKVASSMLGGNSGEGMELMGSLSQLGLSTEQGGSFISMLIDYIKDKVGEQAVAMITEKLPILKSVLG